MTRADNDNEVGWMESIQAPKKKKVLEIVGERDYFQMRDSRARTPMRLRLLSFRLPPNRITLVDTSP